MTDVTIKTLPRSETEETVILSGLEDDAVAAPMAAAMGSSCEVSGAAHLPAHISGRFGDLASARAATVFRLEGVRPSVKHRRDQLSALLKTFGAVDIVEERQSRVLWRAIRDALPFAATGDGHDRPLWRVSTEPAKGFDLSELVSPGAQMFYDWGGGLIWVLMPPADDAGAAELRQAVATLGGHATLVRASPSVRASTNVFHPQDDALAALTKRVKDSFDPRGILNPGRMWAGV